MQNNETTAMQESSNVAAAQPIGLVQRILFTKGLRSLYQRACQHQDVPLCSAILREMGVQYNVSSQDLKRIPTRGPVVVVSNHPFGMLDGAILADLLLSIRPDVKVLTNYLIANVKELQHLCIALDPFGRKNSHSMNRRGMKEALAWLKNDGLLLIFPAGEVSSWRMREGRIADANWTDTASKLIVRTQATALPMFVEGSNSVPFHLLGLVHPLLRTMRLPHELLNKRGKTFTVRIGKPIPAANLTSMGNHVTQYLRSRSYLLARSKPPIISVLSSRFTPLLPSKSLSPIAIEQDMQAVRHEMQQIIATQCLVEDRDFLVFIAESSQIPNMLRELGRAREITFRNVGEGTGQPLDLDAYDHYYKHLILWHKHDNRLAGAYRLGNVDEILAQKGLDGLYTASLFHFQRQFFSRIGPALELGRSFIMTPYQKHYASLINLWKGIGHYLAKHPETPILIGPVSISNQYTIASRELIVRFFAAQNANDTLSQEVSPRTPFVRSAKHAWDVPLISAALQNIDGLSEIISDIEKDGKGIPVLLRQYVKLGGRLLGFNVDKNFSDVLDGLILVDLRQTNPNILERCMGAEGRQTFAAYHAAK